MEGLDDAAGTPEDRANHRHSIAKSRGAGVQLTHQGGETSLSSCLLERSDARRDLSRREAIQWAGSAMLAGLTGDASASATLQPAAKRSKRVVVAGGGIGGLCCAYELMERGHEVTVLEAALRAGGHVKTIYDPLPDGLYADVGAEHFTKPGYDHYWKYVRKFNLPFLAYPRRIQMLRRIDGAWYTEEQLQDRGILARFGFNRREIDFIVQRGWTELPMLYFGPYLDAIADEYQPFGVGLDKYDEITAGELLARDGATDAAIRFNGLRRGDGTQAERNKDVSALFRIWQTAIVKLRGLPVFKREVFRLRGGNQLLTDTFAARLGGRVKLGCPIMAIEQGHASLTVHFREHGAAKAIEAEFMVAAIPLAMLKRIHVKPAWPAPRAHVLQNVQFSTQSRVILQSKTPFWKGDVSSINLETGDPAMYLVYETADEVPGDSSVLMGSGKPDVTTEEARKAFDGFYPGKSTTIERVIVHNWSKDPWAFGCERLPFPLGQLSAFWPHIIEPVGRIHFAGAFADNLPWGMDAATRSANRVAEAIDHA
jgi:monoamine oxidase